MKKIYFLLAFILMTAAHAGAAINGYRSIVFHHIDGKTTAVGIEDNMTTKVADGKVSLECAKGSIEVPCDSLKYWDYAVAEGDRDRWAGLTLIEDDAVGVVMSDYGVRLYNLPDGSIVSLTAIDGRTVLSDRASGSYEIAFSTLSHGVYVLTYNRKSIKIVVK